MNDRIHRLQDALMDFALMGGTALNVRNMPVNRLRRRPLERLTNSLKAPRAAF